MKETAFAVSARPFPLVISRTWYHQTALCATTPRQCPPKASSHHAANASFPIFARAHLFAAAAATAIVTLVTLLPADSATISTERCVSGVGPGCEAAAAENKVIKELQEKSRANKEKNDRAMLEEYWSRGYKPFFSYGYNKDLVKDDDGKWRLQEPNDLRSRVERKIIESVRGKKHE